MRLYSGTSGMPCRGTSLKDTMIGAERKSACVGFLIPAAAVEDPTFRLWVVVVFVVVVVVDV